MYKRGGFNPAPLNANQPFVPAPSKKHLVRTGRFNHHSPARLVRGFLRTTACPLWAAVGWFGRFSNLPIKDVTAKTNQTGFYAVTSSMFSC